MQLLQQTHSSSVVSLKFLSEYKPVNTEYETSDYIKKGVPPVSYVIIPPRNLAETSTILSTTEDIKLLKQVYVFNEIKEIEGYLRNNKFLIDILFETQPQIISIFGRDIELHLELHRDYEEDFEELFVVIKSSFPPAVARRMMDTLDEAWFLDILDKTQGKLCITEEPL